MTQLLVEPTNHLKIGQLQTKMFFSNPIVWSLLSFFFKERKFLFETTKMHKGATMWMLPDHVQKSLIKKK